jgi:uncharacterized protein
LVQLLNAAAWFRSWELNIFRVRHHGHTARIEIPPQAFGAVLKHRKEIVQKLNELGFVYVALNLDGFRSGSLNTILKAR